MIMEDFKAADSLYNKIQLLKTENRKLENFKDRVPITLTTGIHESDVVIRDSERCKSIVNFIQSENLKKIKILEKEFEKI